MSPDLSFSEALELLKKGARISRSGWNGKGMYLEIQVPEEGSEMTLQYIFMKTACGNFVPWLASQTDLLSNDWTAATDELCSCDSEKEDACSSCPDPNAK